MNLAICTQSGITPYSSPKDHSSQHNGLYPMVDFKYDMERDSYTCPAGRTLTTNGSVYDKAGHKVKRYKNRQACKACHLRDLCTKNKNGHFIERSIYQQALDDNKKMSRGKPRILQVKATDHRTPVRDPEKTMGIYLYPDEGKRECTLRGQPDYDLLQPEKTYVHSRPERT